MKTFCIKGIDTSGKLYLLKNSDISILQKFLQADENINLQYEHNGCVRTRMFKTKELLQEINNGKIILVCDKNETET